MCGSSKLMFVGGGIKEKRSGLYPRGFGVWAVEVALLPPSFLPPPAPSFIIKIYTKFRKKKPHCNISPAVLTGAQ